MIKSNPLAFSYMIMDELYTFVGKKYKRYYVWTSIAVTKTGKYFYFYHLSKYKNARALFEFNLKTYQLQIKYIVMDVFLMIRYIQIKQV
jgi:hypothetical protein